ncbi:MAG: response regulator transcription factor [Lachnospiraceae bacterium]|nr:response regulator transcription factor [Lachnospiraceae bacterium]MCI9530506.1 response regulator transcription factor [Lachnospiraceae bacterium]
MNVAICDDEQPGRSRIRSLVQRQGMECQIEEFPSGQALLQAIDGAGEWPDILFLDISMDGMDGISVAKELRARLRESQEPVWGSLPLLIFVSGRPEYMPEAFGVNAFQFLVKPFGEADFNRVFTQAAQEYRFLAAQKQKKPKEILVRSQNSTRSIRAEGIYYVESSNRKVILCLGQEKLEYYGKISRLEQELGSGFFRVHKGFLVNMQYVEQYSRTGVRMQNGDSLLVSKYKYQDFAKAYQDFISEET